MGIKNLTLLAKRFAPNSITVLQNGLKDLCGATLAIDAVLLLRKFLHASPTQTSLSSSYPYPYTHHHSSHLTITSDTVHTDANTGTGTDPIESLVLSRLHRFTQVLSAHDIKPIFVFDGPIKLKAKGAQLALRRARRERDLDELRIERERKDVLVKLREELSSCSYSYSSLSESEEIQGTGTDDEGRGHGQGVEDDRMNESQQQEEMGARRQMKISVKTEAETETVRENDLEQDRVNMVLKHASGSLLYLQKSAEKLQMAKPRLALFEETFQTLKLNTTSSTPTETHHQQQDQNQHQQPNINESHLTTLIQKSHSFESSLYQRSLTLTPALLSKCQNLLTLLQLPVLQAPNEGEALCSRLTTLGVSHATVTEDTDALVFGDGPVVRKSGLGVGGGEMFIMDPVVLRDELGLSVEGMVDLAILCGTDFSSYVIYIHLLYSIACNL
jgi:5'-3' exonuclease